MNLTVHQLIKTQISALFISDDQNRLRYIREPGYDLSELDPAPRFFMGRTLAGNVWRFRNDLPESVVQAVEQVCRHEPIAQNLKETPHQAAVIRALLNKDVPVTEEWRGPAYWIPECDVASTDTTLISDDNAHLLEAHFPWRIKSKSSFETEPVVAKVVQGHAVSICFCARITPDATEAGVVTMADFRGRGFATDAVAGWTTVVRQRGLLPLYSTSWDNVASQGVARKLNMVHYGDDWSIT